MEKETKIGIIGLGTMGNAILERILEKRIFKSQNVFINDKDKKKEKKISERYKIRPSKLNELLAQADFIILAIKPRDFLSLNREISFPKDKIVISIMAGVKIDSLKKTLKVKKIVRAMPNLMVKIGRGVIVWKEQGLDFNEIKIVRRIFNALGIEIRVKDESLIDQATLISGCGPGYLYFFEDLLLKSFVRLGFSRNFTLKLLLNAFLGAILFQKENNYKLEDLLKMVATKGGITEKFLETLKENKINKIFEQAAQNAYERNKKIII
ncbi:MAG: pyrroline-5-carboxylate reductase [Patescibacteria group bacterium]|nr:pyrroline-5-carboxylate reductase [Patescibacteria group bacterium]